MALRILRGTSNQRLEFVPQQGELIFVTDFVTENSDPLFVGDGVTKGGVAVGQNAVLSGDLEGDIDLNSKNIVGTGNINIVGDITASKLTVDDQGILVAVGGSVNLQGGDVNVIGNIDVSGTVEADKVIAELQGTVVSDDGALVLVNSDEKTLTARSIRLNDGPDTQIDISNDTVKIVSVDPVAQLFIGTESQPTSMTHYRTNPELIFSRITVNEDDDTVFPGASQNTVYRGTLTGADPAGLDILSGDFLQGLLIRSFNNNGIEGIAGGSGWFAEPQIGAPAGVVPCTFILGSGPQFVQTIGAALQAGDNSLVLAENIILKYTSQGQLKIGSLVLAKTTTADRDLLPNVEGSVIFNLDFKEIQANINGIWVKLTTEPATEIEEP